MALHNLYTPKQIEILKRSRASDWFMLINHGAKRSGKTIINNDLFLRELLRVKEISEQQNIENPLYILAGFSLENIQNNILTELSNKYGFEFKFDKFNNFSLFGVKVIQTSHGTIGGIGKIRGMTAYGAYINEASLAREEVFDEIKSRCSGEGARIIVDTNPDNPEHWLLKDYIQAKADGIISYHFTLYDNTFLSQRYIDNIVETTPAGMFADRGIKGLWVSGKGAIYSAFDKEKHIISAKDAENIEFERLFCGVDWGYEHYGVIVVFGVYGGSYYLVEEYAHQHMHVDEWAEIALSIKGRYGNIPFYCDSARTEHIAKFCEHGINAQLANKRVLSGIEEVATLINTNRFYVVYNDCPRFREEIYLYCWKPNTGEPLKQNDDVMDSMRYAIYSDMTVNKISAKNTTTKPKVTIDKKIKNIRKLGL